MIADARRPRRRSLLRDNRVLCSSLGVTLESLPAFSKPA